ncbi:MAG: hypothetical protein WBF69_07855 [Castellaniella sp.]|uniref:hypothetical protein n=1 Tax=Castellaniella sp. TaxID=1955812 RepID=UPI003C787A17
MLAPFSNYPVNQAYERLLAEELAARANRPQQSPIARMLDMLFGARQPAPQA